MFFHVLLTFLVQIAFGAITRNWWVGGLVMAAFYVGREITQAEYRWISSFGEGRRANMPFWGGLDWQVWNVKSLGDVLAPMLAALAVWAVVALRRR